MPRNEDLNKMECLATVRLAGKLLDIASDQLLETLATVRRENETKALAVKVPKGSYWVNGHARRIGKRRKRRQEG